MNLFWAYVGGVFRRGGDEREGLVVFVENQVDPEQVIQCYFVTADASLSRRTLRVGFLELNKLYSYLYSDGPDIW